MGNLIKKLYQYKLKWKDLLMIFIVIVVIPVSVSFMLGYEMQANQIKNIPTAVVDHDSSSFSRMLIDEIRTNEIFDIKYYPENDDDIKNLIDGGTAEVGVIIPKGFSDDLKKADAPKVLIFYDGSQMSVASAAKSRMNEILLTVKTGFLKKILEGKLNMVPEESLKQIQPISFNYRLLYNPTKNYRNFMLPGMLVGILQVTLTIMGVMIAEKNQSKFWNLLIHNLKWGIMGTASTIITIGIQCLYFNLPYRGSLLAGIYLTLIYSFAMVGFGMIFGMLIPDYTFATQIACILVLPSSILCGYTYPLMAMPDIFKFVGSVLPYVHYAEPLRDLCMKSIDMKYIMQDIIWLGKFFCIELVIYTVIYFVKKIAFKISANEQTMKA